MSSPIKLSELGILMWPLVLSCVFLLISSHSNGTEAAQTVFYMETI